MDHWKPSRKFLAILVAAGAVAFPAFRRPSAEAADAIDPDAIEIEVDFAQVNDVSRAGNDSWAARGSVNLPAPSSAGPAFTPVQDAVDNGATVSIYQAGSGTSAFAAFPGAVGSYSLVDTHDFAPEQCRARAQGRSLACSDGASILRLRWRRNSANDYRLVVKIAGLDLAGPKPYEIPLAVQVEIPGQGVWEGLPAVENCVVSHNGDRTTCRSKP
ncbi:MAG: hypothetical protein ACKOCT_07710 [Alphaproteobacteria bacterium]